MSDIKQELDRIRDRISDPSFLANKGLSNEVGIHVFCYDPAEVLQGGLLPNNPKMLTHLGTNLGLTWNQL